MGTTKNVDMSATEAEVKKVETPEEKATEKKAAPKRIRSKKYVATKAQVDKTKEYDLKAAIELVKKLSYSKFAGTITAELVVKEAGISIDLNLPHSTGQAKKVVVVDNKVLKEIEAGNLDFDILISTPEFMPKLAKHARVLGPKGLMPNPKNGTLTPNPEQAVKELAAGKMVVKAERKAPLMRINIGKTDMETKALVENIQTIIKVLGPKLKKMSLSATMSPGVKVALEK